MTEKTPNMGGNWKRLYFLFILFIRNSEGTNEKDLSDSLIFQNQRTAYITYCDFNDNTRPFCDWKQHCEGNDNADWIRAKSTTPTHDTGPNGDYPDGNGYFIYMEATNLVPRDAVWLDSSVFNISGDVCVDFFYHMSGSENTNEFKVLVKDHTGQFVYWNRIGNQGTSWLYGSFTFSSSGQRSIQVTFAAIRGLTEYGDIAIDNIGVKNGPCDSPTTFATTKIHTTTTTVKPTAPPDITGGTCSGYGDPHYLTFDNYAHTFMGNCTYTLTKLCEANSTLQHFNVEVDHEYRGGNLHVSYVKQATVYVYNYSISLEKGRLVKVNGVLQKLPLSLPPDLSISLTGQYVAVTAHFGLKVKYDGNHRVEVTLSNKYQGKVCGLCANFNGNHSDDNLNPAGIKEPNSINYGNSWQVNNSLSCSSDAGHTPQCTDEEKLVIESNQACGIIVSTGGIFQNCHLIVDPNEYFGNCYYDMCEFNLNPEILCNSLQAYADACQAAGATVLPWRNETFCPLLCPSNSHSEHCGSACPATCVNPGAPSNCNLPCVEGCVCDPGYILYNNKCVPSHLCGCWDGDIHYPVGSEFWTDEACSTKCTCPSIGGSLICTPASCPSNQYCSVVNGVPGCKDHTFGDCIIHGDPHYYTFDKHTHHFMGICTYTLSKLCINTSLPYFNIEAKNEHRGNPSVSYVQKVITDVYNHKITIVRNEPSRVMVNGIWATLPVTLVNGSLTVTRSVRYVVLETDFLLRVSYDNDHTVEVRVPKTYFNATCGMCGNLNGIIEDESMMPNGQQAQNTNQFGDSWKVDDDDPSCNLIVPIPPPICPQEKEDLYETDVFCGLLTSENGPFQACHSLINPTSFLDSCVFDLCALDGSKDALCTALEAYADACQRVGVTISWRNSTFCPLKCHINSHYEVCASACPATCTNQNASNTCNRPCMEGCECDAGFVLSGGSCVSVSNCGCIYNGKYYEKEEMFWQGECESQCKCIGNNTVSCTTEPCGPHQVCKVQNGVQGCYPAGTTICHIYGDPHYITFDGKLYHFQGSCNYTVVEACKNSSVNFSITARNEHRGSLSWTALNSVAVNIGNLRIILGKNKIVQVNEVIVSLPLIPGPGISLTISGSYVVLQTDFGLEVKFSGDHDLFVQVNEKYKRQLCGLCGTYNENILDDFLKPDGLIAHTSNEFGNSWRVPDDAWVCEPDAVEPSPCNPVDEKHYEDECKIIFLNDGPFKDCHFYVLPQLYFETCVYDQCATGGNLGQFCNSLEAYADACQNAGIHLGDWKKDTICTVPTSSPIISIISTTITTPTTVSSHRPPSVDTCQMACSFDVDLCKWQQSTSDKINWIRLSGPTPAELTGPSFDHTTGTGFYLYIDSTSSTYSDFAQLISPECEISGTHCFRFWYHMYGTSEEMELKVSILTEYGLEDVTYLYGNYEDMWHLEEILLLNEEKFQIIISGTRGETERSDIAIDDISLVPGYCVGPSTSTSSTVTTARATASLPTPSSVNLPSASTVSTTPSPVTPSLAVPTSSPIISIISTTITTPTTVSSHRPPSVDTCQMACSFDVDLCKWQQSTSDTINWIRLSGPTPAELTGPSFDHTTGIGFYLYIDSTSSRYLDFAQLISPECEISGTHCFRFWYHMYGTSEKMELKVSIRTEYGLEDVTYLYGNKEDMWHLEEILLLNEEKFEIIISGTRGETERSDIAIDDISLVPGYCVGPSTSTSSTVTTARATASVPTPSSVNLPSASTVSTTPSPVPPSLDPVTSKSTVASVSTQKPVTSPTKGPSTSTSSTVTTARATASVPTPSSVNLPSASTVSTTPSPVPPSLDPVTSKSTVASVSTQKPVTSPTKDPVTSEATIRTVSTQKPASSVAVGSSTQSTSRATSSGSSASTISSHTSDITSGTATTISTSRSTASTVSGYSTDSTSGTATTSVTTTTSSGTTTSTISGHTTDITSGTTITTTSGSTASTVSGHTTNITSGTTTHTTSGTTTALTSGITDSTVSDLTVSIPHTSGTAGSTVSGHTTSIISGTTATTSSATTATTISDLTTDITSGSTTSTLSGHTIDITLGTTASGITYSITSDHTTDITSGTTPTTNSGSTTSIISRHTSEVSSGIPTTIKTETTDSTVSHHTAGVTSGSITLTSGTSGNTVSGLTTSIISGTSTTTTSATTDSIISGHTTGINLGTTTTTTSGSTVSTISGHTSDVSSGITTTTTPGTTSSTVSHYTADVTLVPITTTSGITGTTVSGHTTSIISGTSTATTSTTTDSAISGHTSDITSGIATTSPGTTNSISSGYTTDITSGSPTTTTSESTDFTVSGHTTDITSGSSASTIISHTAVTGSSTSIQSGHTTDITSGPTSSSSGTTANIISGYTTDITSGTTISSSLASTISNNITSGTTKTTISETTGSTNSDHTGRFTSETTDSLISGQTTDTTSGSISSLTTSSLISGHTTDITSGTTASTVSDQTSNATPETVITTTSGAIASTSPEYITDITSGMTITITSGATGSTISSQTTDLTSRNITTGTSASTAASYTTITDITKETITATTLGITASTISGPLTDITSETPTVATPGTIASTISGTSSDIRTSGSSVTTTTPGISAPQCPPNSHYEQCGTACPATCANPGAPSNCNLPCVEGCICDPGYLLNGNKCVPSDKCGCWEGDKHHPVGSEFWSDDTCSSRCTCPSPGSSIVCSNASCPSNQYCGITNGVPGCYFYTYGICRVHNDPHYDTFDRQNHNFMGLCTYTLAKPCNISTSLPYFNVEAKNEHRGNPSVSFVEKVLVEVYDQKVQILRHERNRVLVNDIWTTLPVTLVGGSVKVRWTGKYVTLETDFRLTVSYDTDTSVEVKVPSTYSKQTCGMCGNFNNRKQDDFMMPNGQQAKNSEELGHSWIVDDGDPLCHPDDPEPTPVPPCSPEKEELYKSDGFCGLLTSKDGPFQMCHSVVNPSGFFESCMFDLCALDGDKNILCSLLSAYADACQKEGVLINWRNITHCEPKCAPNSHYNACASACPVTCLEPNAPDNCSLPCTEGCECDEGYVISGGTCVSKSNCGCLYNDTYYDKGESFLNDNCENRCECQGNNNMVCVPVSCAEGEICKVENGSLGCYRPSIAICHIYGDPHYSTFDGTLHHFQGSCNYTVAETCVNTTNNFIVTTRNEHRGSQSWTAINSVALTVDGVHILLDKGNSVYVNNISVTLPANVSGIDIVQNGLYVIITTSFGLQLQFNGDHELFVKVLEIYKGTLCGLCGTYNDDRNDDFTIPNGTVVTNVNDFGNSWRVPDDEWICDSTPPTPPTCPPTLQQEAEGKCWILKDVNGPFRPCHKYLRPNQYFESCIFDYCGTGGSDDLLCEALKSYAAACEALGVSLGHWKNNTICDPNRTTVSPPETLPTETVTDVSSATPVATSSHITPDSKPVTSPVIPVSSTSSESSGTSVHTAMTSSGPAFTISSSTLDSTTFSGPGVSLDSTTSSGPSVSGPAFTISSSTLDSTTFSDPGVSFDSTTSSGPSVSGPAFTISSSTLDSTTFSGPGVSLDSTTSSGPSISGPAFTISSSTLDSTTFSGPGVSLDSTTSSGPSVSDSFYTTPAISPGISATSSKTSPYVTAPQCPPNSHYEQCGTACPATCANPGAPSNCNLPCVEGCICDPGYLLNGNKCVPSDKCGCWEGDKHYPVGSEFWSDDTCSSRCTCPSPGSGIVCTNTSCPNNQYCGITNGVPGCYFYTYGICRIHNDPHYDTFDRQNHNFMGLCTYTLAKPCNRSTSLPYFNVEAKNEHRGDPSVSFVEKVLVEVYDQKVQIVRHEKNRVLVNGIWTTLPVTLVGGSVKVRWTGKYVTLETDFRLTVSYDTDTSVEVKVPSTYSKQTCGMCGNFNNRKQDDFMMPNGQQAKNSEELGHSWIVDDGDPLCHPDDPEPTPVPPCSPEKEELYKSDGFCGLLTSKDGPFQMCHSVVNPSGFFESCMFDLCALDGDKNILCSLLSAYADACQKEGVLINWRNITHCEPKCQSNSHYNACASACPVTCLEPNRPDNCSLPCTEGCECDEGYVISGGTCVSQSDCGCLYNDTYYDKGESFLKDNCENRCECQGNNNTVCVPVSCAEGEICKVENGSLGCYRPSTTICHIYGDPHYSTFDGTLHHFQGSCNYTVAETCVNTTNNFIVTTRNEHRGSQSWTAINSVALTVDGVHILLDKGNIVYINNISVTLPANVSGIDIVQSGQYVVVTTDFGLQLQFNGDHELLIKVTEAYKGTLCGLCGTYNDNRHDDFTIPNGTVVTNVNDFGNSWRVPDDEWICDSTPPPPPTCPPTLEQEAEGKCWIIKDTNGPFRPCYKYLRPHQYFESCVFDYCGTGGSDDLLCEALKSYAAACEALGVSLGHWKNDTICDPNRTTVLPPGTSPTSTPTDVTTPKSTITSTTGRTTPLIPAHAICSASGDPHYNTFDGAVHHYMGNCSYTLSKLCSAPSADLPFFHVYTTNEHRGSNTKVSYVQSVHIEVYNNAFTLLKNKRLNVNGTRTNPPISEENKFRAYISGNYLVFETDFGLRVKFDGNHYVDVTLPSKYRNHVCGLCGNYNGQSGDDLLKPDGNFAANSKEFGDSWIVEENKLCGSEDLETCDPQLREEYSKDTVCGLITDPSGIFKDCHAVVPPSNYFENCLLDMCFTEGASLSLCYAVQAYAERCSSAGVCVEWRSQTFCPISCPGGSKYEFCATGCPATCYNLTSSAVCNVPHLEGCVCNTGYLLSGDRCVPESECGCIDKENNYHQLGENWFIHEDCSERCTCSKGNNIVCSAWACGALEKCEVQDGVLGCHASGYAACHVSGDPHYFTFDQVMHSYMGTCTYTLVKVCDSSNIIPVTIIGKNEERGQRGATYLKEIYIDVYNIRVTLQKRRITLVDNNRIHTPWTAHLNGVSVSTVGIYTVVETDFGMRVKFDGDHHLEILLPDSYFAKVCGMCGNYNSQQNDELLMANGLQATNVTEFGNSWKSEKDSDTGCLDDTRVDLGPPCSPALRPTIQNQCNVLLTDTFKACHQLVNPDPFIQSCVYDMCRYDGMLSTLCAIAQAYVDACKTKGVTIKWRNPKLCPFACPTNSHYTDCASLCPPTCNNIFAPAVCDKPSVCMEGCACDDGYVLSGEQCVKLSKCGCRDSMDNYYNVDETWIKTGCRERCTCKQGNNIECKTFSCNGGNCDLNKQGKYYCKPTGYSFCAVAGDPHYRTFDGLMHHFQGKESYTLAKTSSDISDLIEPFIIESKNEEMDKYSPFSILKEMRIKVYNHVIIFKRKREIVLDGIKVLPPVRPHEGIHIYQKSTRIYVETDFGLAVNFDGFQNGEIVVPNTYMTELEGLCGNYDGRTTNDFTNPDGVQVRDVRIFGESWKVTSWRDSFRYRREAVERLDEEVDDENILNTGDNLACSSKELTYMNSSSFCGVLRDATGPFRECHPYLSPESYITNCLFDTCAEFQSRELLCDNLEQYAINCQKNGSTAQNWRALTGCAMSCPAASLYKECMNSCPATCSDLASESECESPCAEGCQCDPGYVLSGYDCVPYKQCGCTFENSYYKIGEEFITVDCTQKCTCTESSTPDCVEYKCKNDEICTIANFTRDCYVPGPCLDNPCENGGTCIEDPPGMNSTYGMSCLCPDTYTGFFCEAEENVYPETVIYIVIGVIIGVFVLLFIFAFAAYFCLKSRKKKKGIIESIESSESGSIRLSIRSGGSAENNSSPNIDEEHGAVVNIAFEEEVNERKSNEVKGARKLEGSENVGKAEDQNVSNSDGDVNMISFEDDEKTVKNAETKNTNTTVENKNVTKADDDKNGEKLNEDENKPDDKENSKISNEEENMMNSEDSRNVKTEEDKNERKADKDAKVRMSEEGSKSEENVNVDKPEEGSEVSKSEENVTVDKPDEGAEVSKSEEGKNVSKSKEGEDVSKSKEGEDVSKSKEGEDVSKSKEGEDVSKTEEGAKDSKPKEGANGNKSEKAVDVKKAKSTDGKSEKSKDISKSEDLSVKKANTDLLEETTEL